LKNGINLIKGLAPVKTEIEVPAHEKHKNKERAQHGTSRLEEAFERFRGELIKIQPGKRTFANIELH